MEMNMENPPNRYRYERKYKLNIEEYDSLINALYEEGMIVSYPTRQVNNLYFDTLMLDSYFENVEGISERNKYRLRWYGERFNTIDPIFEIKIKRDAVNIKQVIKIDSIKFKDLFEIDEIFNHVVNNIETSNGAVYIEMLSKIPTLLNGYQRDYFETNDRKIRLTIDKDIYYYNCINQQEYNAEEVMIVEVKYPSKETPRLNFDRFKLNIGKSSKYVSGLNFTKDI